IGGNDILGPTTSTEFETDLRRLLVAAEQCAAATVMFELPLPPFGNSFGRVQRQLAQQFGVALIPKRHIAGVLAAPGTTIDGLHLSPHGHELVMALLWRVIIPIP
ncbi:MAG: SGNH/GDSL hydrolase family protein, partial [Verrucomicrobiota bacterium]